MAETAAALLFVAAAGSAFAFGVWNRPRAGATGATAVLVAVEGVTLLAGGGMVPGLLATAAGWLAGCAVRSRRMLIDGLARRNRELAAEQDAFTRLAVGRERARIARDLHDIVAHNLAAIVVQAGAGRMEPPDDPRRAAERFAHIRDAGNQTLIERAQLTQTLAAGRGEGAGLDALLEAARATGLDLRLTPLPAGVVLSRELEEVAYRVVQEGLTNALKHAPGAAIHVALRAGDGTLEIDVRNDGASANRPPMGGSGAGLVGMRERVEALGGRLEAGPDGTGWLVRARLPISRVPPRR